MNKQELIKKIKRISDISDKEKSYLIDLVNTKKKYGLVWENKPEDVEEQLRSMLPVFKEVKERAIISDDKTAPNHILIEGDNLHALTALTYTHEEKIDVIYIDPPYNTGNKDFIYNDHYVDKEDTYRHSKWLSFMEKRLKIAKQLLSEKGVIFISINDVENAQLKMLCSEIFNENNFIANMVWANKEGGGSSDSKHIRIKHEYVVCYAKNKILSEINGVEITNEVRYKSKDQHIDVRGPYYTQKLGMGSIQYSESLDYQIKCPDGTFTTPRENNSGKKACWRWSQNKFKWGILNDFVEFKKDKNGVWIVYTKQYLRCDNEGNLIERSQRPFGLIESFSSTQASKKMEDLGLSKLFSYSKPSDLIHYIIKLTKSEIVLDFFAGSGTTLHATMALNAEDGGNRRCILVTNNENNIAEEVTFERNKRVIQGYTTAKGDQVEGLTNNNLRYYQSDFIPSARTEVNRRLLTARSTELLCIKENCYHCITADFGINPKQAQLFTDLLGRYMVVVYHSRSMEAVVEKLTEVIQGLETTEKVKIYAFSPEKDSIEDDFFAVQDKIETVPLPDSIYNAYVATFRNITLNQNQAAAST